jgi:hypothetical protein
MLERRRQNCQTQSPLPPPPAFPGPPASNSGPLPQSKATQAKQPSHQIQNVLFMALIMESLGKVLVSHFQCFCRMLKFIAVYVFLPAAFFVPSKESLKGTFTKVERFELVLH